MLLHNGYWEKFIDFTSFYGPRSHVVYGAPEKLIYPKVCYKDEYFKSETFPGLKWAWNRTFQPSDFGFMEGVLR